MKTNPTTAAARLVLLAATFSCVLSACGDKGNTLTDEDRAAITQQHKTATDPAEADPMHIDWKAFTEAHYSEDAVLLPPNSPDIVGRDAIIAYMSTWPPVTRFQVEDLKMEGTSELAYIHVSYDVTMQVNDSTQFTETGRDIELWKKYDDGTWRCFLDIWCPDQPLPPTL